MSEPFIQPPERRLIGGEERIYPPPLFRPGSIVRCVRSFTTKDVTGSIVMVGYGTAGFVVNHPGGISGNTVTTVWPTGEKISLLERDAKELLEQKWP